MTVPPALPTAVTSSTAARFETLIATQKAIADALADQADTLAEVSKTIAEVSETAKDLGNRLDRSECTDWNRRIRAYNESLRGNPRQPFVNELKRLALMNIAGLPNCMVEP